MKKLLLLLFSVFCFLFSVEGQTAYVPNSADNTVTVIDVATNIVTATIPVGSGPSGVSVSSDGTKVYVGNFFDNTISVINTTNNMVSDTIPVINGNPFGVSVSQDGSKVYVANPNANTVSVINTTTNTLSATIPVGLSPHGVVVSPNGSKVYITNRSSNTVSVINTVTNTVTATIPVGISPMGIIVSPNGSKVYVANNNVSGTLSVISTATNTVSGIISVGLYPYDICITPNANKVYVTNMGATTIRVINTATNTVSSTITVGNSPNGISVSPDGTRVFVANASDSTVSVINTSSDSLITSINVGSTSISFGNFISPFTAPVLSTDSVATSFCAGSSLSIPFTTSDTLNNGNIFTAQLSDASGSFANPVNIGTLTDTIAGSISAIIPANTPAGAGYRIRVVSSSPVATGADNGTNITINPLPTVALDFGTLTFYGREVCHWWSSLALNGGSPAGGSYIGSIVTNDSIFPSITPIGIYPITYTYIDSNSCSNSATDSVFIDICIGVSTIDNEESTITISPNPFTNQFIVNSEQLTVKEIKVYNLIGEEVLQSTIDNHPSTINLSGFAKGIYFIEIKTEQGIVRKKIVKQ